MQSLPCRRLVLMRREILEAHRRQRRIGRVQQPGDGRNGVIGPEFACTNVLGVHAQLLFTPGFAVQGVSRDPRGSAAADELSRQTQRLALRLVFKAFDEFLAEAEAWIPGKHVCTKVQGNIPGAPP